MENEQKDYAILLAKAKEFAIQSHRGTNHIYDEYPYEMHLILARMVGSEFLYLIPGEKREIVLASIWCHDLIEDCRQTYHDIVATLENEEVANIVFAVTNEKGKNRKERANEKYYFELKQNILAIFVKLCDRIANVRYSKYKNDPLYTAYQREQDNFKQSLYVEEYKEMFDYLDKLLQK